MKRVFWAVLSLSLMSLTISIDTFAQEKMRFNFPTEDIDKIVDAYSKATGTRIIMDSTVRGRISIMNPSDVTYDQALNQLAEALAINGFSLAKKDDYWTIRNARSNQRDNLEVTTSLPMLNPQRMATWIVTLRYASAVDVYQSIGRMLSSSFGEATYIKSTNQLIISDFTSTLHRIHKVLLEVDKPNDPKFFRINEQLQRAERNKKNLEEKSTDGAASEAKPSSEAKPAADSKPSSETKSNSESKPNSDAKPTSDSKAPGDTKSAQEKTEKVDDLKITIKKQGTGTEKAKSNP